MCSPRPGKIRSRIPSPKRRPGSKMSTVAARRSAILVRGWTTFARENKAFARLYTPICAVLCFGMTSRPLRTTVIGSYPFPGWLEFAVQHLDEFGEADRAELIGDAVRIAITDQTDAGRDVITDGEQTRLDFNLSFYGFIEGIELESASPRRFGPPAHDQRGKHKVTGNLAPPRGLGTVEDFQRLKRLAPSGPTLKASVPGPYTLSGRLVPNQRYSDRYALTEALLPIVRAELEALVKAGCS